MVHFYGVIPMSYQQIEARVNELCENFSLDLDDIFLAVCAEFGLPGAAIADSLGCKCPYGLLGYLEAEANPLPD